MAAGVRRIEALTGEAALAYVAQEEGWLGDTATMLKVTPGEVSARVKALLEEKKRLEAEIADARRKLATGEGGGSGTKRIGDTVFCGKVLEGLPAKELRSAADSLRKEIGEGIVALVAVNDGKASLVVTVSDQIKDRLDAVSLLRAGVVAIGGKGGGGRPDFAQGGGPDGASASAAIEAIETAIGERLAA